MLRLTQTVVICGLLAAIAALGAPAAEPLLSAAVAGGAAEAASAAVCRQDGSDRAPPGKPQHPILLDGYVTRSPCRVAGVDYAVGIAEGRRLKDPTVAANLPPGLTYNPVQKLVRCDSGSGLVVEDLDFSLHNGVGLYLYNCKDTIVRHNRFQMGRNCVGAIVQSPTSVGIRVEYNLIDGGGGTTSTGCNRDRIGEMVTLGATGGEKTVRYNHLRNAPQHFLTFTGSGEIDLRFNLIERCGFYQGAHCNGFQIVGGVWRNPRIEYNTFVSAQPDTALGPVTGLFKRGSNEIAGLVLGGRESSLLSGMTVDSTALPTGTDVIGQTTRGGVTTLIVSQRAMANGPANLDVTNAYPFGMVIPIRYVAQIGGDLAGGTILGNTVVTKGPILGVSYAIYCSADNDPGYRNVNTRATVSGNYLDLSGAVGAFYPSRICTDSRFGSPLPNVDMRTGRKIAGP